MGCFMTPCMHLASTPCKHFRRDPLVGFFFIPSSTWQSTSLGIPALVLARTQPSPSTACWDNW